MKKIISLIIIVLSIMPIYGKKINYKSSCIYYYLPIDECMDSKGYIDFEYAASKGLSAWVLIILDNGDALFESRPWGSFFYGISNGQTIRYNRQQAIEDLNYWLNFYYSIAKQDRKYKYDGYSTSYYYYGTDTVFKAYPELNVDPDLLKNGDKVDLFFGNLHSTNKDLYITKNHEAIVMCPTKQAPYLDESEGTANYTMFIRFDIEYYLPK